MRNNKPQTELQNEFYKLLQKTGVSEQKAQIQTLLENGLDLHHVPALRQTTYFQYAVMLNNIDVSIIQLLIDFDPNVLSQQYLNKFNIVDYTALYGHLTTVHFLKEQDLDFTSPLAKAAYEGNITVLEKQELKKLKEHHLLHYAVAGAGARNDLTLLRFLLAAMARIHPVVSDYLDSEKININLVLEDGATPLFIACQKGHLEVVRALLEAGAQMDQARTDDGATPLWSACYNGHLEVVRALLKAGAQVDQARRDDGASPLFIACQKGHLEVVRALIEAGAQVDQARTNDGASPLFIACQKGHLEVVCALLKAGAQVDQARTDDGVTPLWVASYFGHLEVVCALLKAGAQVDQARTEGGVTPLWVACRKGHLEVIRALLKAGAQVDQARTEDGITPLWVASYFGHLEVVHTLIGGGATTHGKAIDNALSAASPKGHVGVVRLLLAEKEKKVKKRQNKNFLKRFFTKKEKINRSLLQNAINQLNPQFVWLLLKTAFYYKSLNLNSNTVKQIILKKRNDVEQSTDLSEEEKAKQLDNVSKITFLLFSCPPTNPVGFPMETPLDRNMLREGFFHRNYLPPVCFRLLMLLRYAKQDIDIKPDPKHPKKLLWKEEPSKQNALWDSPLPRELWFLVLEEYLCASFPFLSGEDSRAIGNTIASNIRALEKQTSGIFAKRAEKNDRALLNGTQTTTVSVLENSMH